MKEKLPRKNAAEKIQTKIFCGQKQKVFIKIKYPEQVAEPESSVTVRIFLFGAVSSKKRYLPTASCQNDEKDVDLVLLITQSIA